MRYDNTKVGQTIKAARIAKGLTQSQLASASGISLRSIQRIENGEVAARSFTLSLLKQNLGFSLDAAHMQNQKTNTQDNPDNILQIEHRKKNIYNYILAGLIFSFSGIFLTTSTSFPETDFELYAFIIATIVIYNLLKSGSLTSFFRPHICNNRFFSQWSAVHPNQTGKRMKNRN